MHYSRFNILVTNFTSELLIHIFFLISMCVVAEISVCSDISLQLKELPKQKIRVGKIELKLIMSDVAVRDLGALIFFANLKKRSWLLSAGRVLSS